MISEEVFISKILKIITEELTQIERMLVSMRSDEVQMAYLRGERVRLQQMKGILTDRLEKILQKEVYTYIGNEHE